MKKYQVDTVIVDSIPVRYTIPQAPIQSIFFLGLGQRGRNLTWVAKGAPRGMVVVEAVPYAMKRTPEEMMRLGISVVNHISSLFNISTMTLFSESQSSPATVLAFSESGQLPKTVVCIAPLGFTYHQQGNSKRQRTNKMLKDSVRFWFGKHQRLTIKPNVETFRYSVLQNLTTPLVTWRAFNLAANLHVQDEAESIARQIPFHVFAGSHDELFMYQDIKKQLTHDTKVILHELPNIRHLNRATPKGMEQLHGIYQEISSML